MDRSEEERVTQAHEALDDGRWPEARDHFLLALEGNDDPTLLDGLATALWWLGDVRAALSTWERAFAGHVRNANPADAANIGILLSLLHEANNGNTAVATGWADRARRVAEPLDDPILFAWCDLAICSTTEDVVEARSLAEAARAVGHAHGDRDLELCALSMMGAALVSSGQVGEGARLLDEALTGALAGEAQRLDTVVLAACVLLDACVQGADFRRVAQWAASMTPFTDRYGCPYLFASCRTHHGAMLLATGDWPGAEAELGLAIATSGDGLPAVRDVATAHLADLHLSRGQVEEARRLTEGIDNVVEAVAVGVDCCLALGDAALAASLAGRELSRPATTGGMIEHGRLREALGDALVELGELDGAWAEVERLLAFDDAELLRARGLRLRARCTSATDPSAALQDLHEAKRRFSSLGLVLEVARCRHRLAVLLGATEPELAVEEARLALVAFDQLGARRDADAAAAWLRAAGVRSSRAARAEDDLLSTREVEVFALVREGLSNPEIAERLYISRRTVEHHVASILAKLGVRNRVEAIAMEFGAPTDGNG